MQRAEAIFGVLLRATTLGRPDLGFGREPASLASCLPSRQKPERAASKLQREHRHTAVEMAEAMAVDGAALEKKAPGGDKEFMPCASDASFAFLACLNCRRAPPQRSPCLGSHVCHAGGWRNTDQ